MAYRFVKLTHQSGEPIYINADYVVAVYKPKWTLEDADPLPTVLILNHPEKTKAVVRETPDEVMDFIKQRTMR